MFAWSLPACSGVLVSALIVATRKKSARFACLAVPETPPLLKRSWLDLEPRVAAMKPSSWSFCGRVLYSGCDLSRTAVADMIAVGERL